jgi:hypothetical protein
LKGVIINQSPFLVLIWRLNNILSFIIFRKSGCCGCSNRFILFTHMIYPFPNYIWIVQLRTIFLVYNYSKKKNFSLLFLWLILYYYQEIFHLALFFILSLNKFCCVLFIFEHDLHDIWRYSELRKKPLKRKIFIMNKLIFLRFS